MTTRLKLYLLWFVAWLAYGCFARAQSAQLAWDYSGTNVATFTLFATTNAAALTNIGTSTVILNVGTNKSCTIDNLSPGRWWFFATATVNGFTSIPSDALMVQVPAPPSNMRVVVVQYAGAIDAPWSNLFFKIKVP